VSGVHDFLWEHGQEVGRAIERYSADIEDLERKIVEARAKRDELQLFMVELQVVRNLVEQAGITVERRGADVHVSVERTLAEAASAAKDPE
jgi:hypothetical protein